MGYDRSTQKRARCSEALVDYLREDNPGGCDLVSLDVEDMFYSIPHGELMKAVEECIQSSGSVAFMNSTGLAVESFLELLTFYLSSTYITFEGEIFLQKSGICIGSSVAPILSDLYLARCDRALAELLDCRVLRVFRYVDDYLVVFKDSLGPNRDSVCVEVLASFKECSPGLSFKYETPTGEGLQFLDLRLTLQPSHTCWAYEPRSKKRLLPYGSAHSKLVKRAITTSGMRAPLLKSCHHRCEDSLLSQVSRLTSAGYPVAMIVGVAESLVKVFGGRTSPKARQKPTTRPVVVP